MENNGGYTVEMFLESYEKLSKKQKQNLRKVLQIELDYSPFVLYTWRRLKVIPERTLVLLKSIMNRYEEIKLL